MRTVRSSRSRAILRLVFVRTLASRRARTVRDRRQPYDIRNTEYNTILHTTLHIMIKTTICHLHKTFSKCFYIKIST